MMFAQWAVVKIVKGKPRVIVCIKTGKLAARTEASVRGGARAGYYVRAVSVWLPD